MEGNLLYIFFLHVSRRQSMSLTAAVTKKRSSVVDQSLTRTRYYRLHIASPKSMVYKLSNLHFLLNFRCLILRQSVLWDCPSILFLWLNCDVHIIVHVYYAANDHQTGKKDTSSSCPKRRPQQLWQLQRNHISFGAGKGFQSDHTKANERCGWSPSPRPTG